MTVNAVTWQRVSAELSGIYPVLAGISGTEADHGTGRCASTAPSDLMKEKQDAGNTPRYINDLLKVWRTWFNYLVEEGYLEERDTFAQMQLKNGLDLYSVSRLMGHVNIMITQRYLLGIKDKDIVDRGTQTSPLMNL